MNMSKLENFIYKIKFSTFSGDFPLGETVVTEWVRAKTSNRETRVKAVARYNNISDIISI